MTKPHFEEVELLYPRKSQKSNVYRDIVMSLLVGVLLYFLIPFGDESPWWWLLAGPVAILSLLGIGVFVDDLQMLRIPNPFLRAHAKGIDFNLVTGPLHLAWDQIVDVRGAMTKQGPIISIFIRHPEQFAEQQGKRFLRKFGYQFKQHGTYFSFPPKEFTGNGIHFLAACSDGLKAAKAKAEDVAAP